MARRNRLVVPGARESLEQMKNEIAQEFGVELGADTTARANGSVGGEMTKRLVALGSQVMEQQRKGKAGEMISPAFLCQHHPKSQSLT